jgi:hypothetical protein
VGSLITKKFPKKKSYHKWPPYLLGKESPSINATKVNNENSNTEK